MSKKNPLVADKELFRLWYEFYLLALTSTDLETQQAVKKTKSFYADWNADPSVKFDLWWAKHSHLFEQKRFVKVVSNVTENVDNSIFLQIPLDKSKAELFDEIRTLLNTVLPSNIKGSVASVKYVPSEEQGVKRDSVRMLLDLEKRVFRKELLKGEKLTERVIKFFTAERYKRNPNRVPPSFIIENHRNNNTESNVERNIRRYRQKAKKLILNVANGDFPGKY